MAKPKTTSRKEARPIVGRPSTFSKETADAICQRIADGESLRKICADEHMPAKSTVFLWLINNPGFSDQYARAREVQAASYADDIVDIADTEKDPQKARVRIDARKWHASKLAPKKYGDKVTNEHSGPDGAPIAVRSEPDLSKLTKEQRDSYRAIIRVIAGQPEKDMAKA